MGGNGVGRIVSVRRRSPGPVVCQPECLLMGLGTTDLRSAGWQGRETLPQQVAMIPGGYSPPAPERTPRGQRLLSKIAEGMGQRDEFLDIERLGAELAAESLRLEPGVDLGLGPLVAPEPGQDVAEVLAAVEEDLAHQTCGTRRRRRPWRAWRRRAGWRSTAESTLGRGQKTDGGSARTIDTSASAWTSTESAP